MCQAIYYIKKNDVNQNAIAQKDEAFINAIPKHATNIPIGDVLDKETLLKSLAKVANFPSYFAHNWDSAWDCLTDSDITDFTLYLNAVEKINSEDFNVFKRLIEDAYKDFGKPQLWIIEASDDAYA
ncbi:barstar family protein [Psychrobacter faecalis]|uniref:barstar family protein n=1 Tax=Psychrobacter faecalis TaxID=180588 RepID=UPI003FCEF607